MSDEYNEQEEALIELQTECIMDMAEAAIRGIREVSLNPKYENAQLDQRHYGLVIAQLVDVVGAQGGSEVSAQIIMSAIGALKSKWAEAGEYDPIVMAVFDAPGKDRMN